VRRRRSPISVTSPRADDGALTGRSRRDRGRAARARASLGLVSTDATAFPPEQHDFDFEFLGLAGLHDPVRPGVADAVADCLHAGVRVVMITGDYPGTALAIAREIGLDDSAGCITAKSCWR